MRMNVIEAKDAVAAPRVPELREVPDPAPKNVVRRPRTADDWLIAILSACSLMFAVALAAYIFYPAMTTLVASSVKTWSAGGF
jgi:hypothetical protein